MESGECKVEGIMLCLMLLIYANYVSHICIWAREFLAKIKEGFCTARPRGPIKTQ